MLRRPLASFLFGVALFGAITSAVSRVWVVSAVFAIICLLYLFLVIYEIKRHRAGSRSSQHL